MPPSTPLIVLLSAGLTTFAHAGAFPIRVRSFRQQLFFFVLIPFAPRKRCDVSLISKFTLAPPPVQEIVLPMRRIDGLRRVPAEKDRYTVRSQEDTDWLKALQSRAYSLHSVW